TNTQDTVTAFYSGAIKTAAISVTPVVTAGLASGSINSASIPGGTSATGTVTLTAPAPGGGLVVYLWTNGSPAFVPASITIPAGSTTGAFNVTTITVSSSMQDTITAFYQGASQTAVVTVTP